MAGRPGSKRRERGYIRKRGGSYQVLVYAGPDPLTGKDRYLTGSSRSEREAEKLRTRFLAQVDQRRVSSTRATLGYALDAWLEVHDAEPSTLASYLRTADRTIRPALGDVPLAKVTARTLEEFYAQLRRCRKRCDGNPHIEHRTTEPHECRTVRHRRRPGRPAAAERERHDCAEAGCEVVECRQHVCKPLAPATILEIHWIISGALAAAVRWEWISSNPAAQAKKPKQTKPKPSPPTSDQAARIVAAAWEQGEQWGMLVWLVMVTGIRRGELLALRWHDIHLDTGMLEIRRGYTHQYGRKLEKDTKTHQIRRIALDETTVELLQAHWERYQQQVDALGVEPDATAFVFSYEPDHSAPSNPDGVSHRYTKMCADLGIATHLHALRHYSATELISSGVDVRTVAGRLGHGGGGTTTLRVYAAWSPESDKRAAELLASKMRAPEDKLNK